MSSIKDALEVLKDLDEIKLLIELLARESEPYVDRFIDTVVDKEDRAIKGFIERGYTKQEAMMLVMNLQSRLSKSTKS